MMFFPGSVYAPNADITKPVDRVAMRMKQFGSRVKEERKFMFFVIAFFCTMSSLVFLLVCILGNAPPNLAQNIYFYKAHFETLPLSSISSDYKVTSLQQTGLDAYYTIGATGYCSPFECHSFSPFYFNIERVITDNLNSGYGVTIPTDIADKAGFMMRTGKATWVFFIVAVILNGITFLSSLGAYKFDDMALLTTILAGVGSLMLSVATILTTVAVIIYCKAYGNVMDEYKMVLEPGSVGLPLLHCSSALAGVASLFWYLMHRHNRKLNQEDVENMLRQHQERQQAEQQQHDQQHQQHQRLSSRPNHSPQVSENLQNRNISSPRPQNSQRTFVVTPRVSTKTFKTSLESRRRPSTQTMVSTNSNGNTTMIHNGRQQEPTLLEPREDDDEPPRHLQNATARTE